MGRDCTRLSEWNHDLWKDKGREIHIGETSSAINEAELL
jgi:hypothetical protein